MNFRIPFVSLLALGLLTPLAEARTQSASIPIVFEPGATVTALGHLFHDGLGPVAGEEPEADGFPVPHDIKTDVLALQPMVVRENQQIRLPPLFHEAPIQEFLRTGTIAEKIRHRFTVRLWTGGGPDGGLRVIFSW